MINLRTLVLSANYMPVSVFPELYTISAEQAIQRYLSGNCDVAYWYDRKVLTPSRDDLHWPSVIVNHNTRSFRQGVRLKKSYLFYREHARCYWCDKDLSIKEMTFDHVHPVSKGGKHDWLNAVGSCEKCNWEKADAMPVGKWKPRKPLYAPTFAQLLAIRKRYPVVIRDDNWRQFLPGWADDMIILHNPGKYTEKLTEDENECITEDEGVT